MKTKTLARNGGVTLALLGVVLAAPPESGAASISYSPARRSLAFEQQALASVLTFTPVKDAMVKEAVPASNFGTLSNFQVSNQPSYRKVVYLQFNVTGIPPGASNITASLRVNAITTATSRPITAHAVSNTSWGETTINWDTRLPLGTALSSVSSHTAGQSSVWDVSDHVTGNGGFTIALDTTFLGDTNFTSSEGGASPELVISYDTAVTYKVFRGNTHSHTSYTSSHGAQDGYPDAHHALAKSSGYDFYVTTDHSQEDAFEPTSATNPAWVDTKQQAMNATDTSYVGFWGYEHSENNGPDGTGHINVINSPAYLDALEAGVGIQSLYSWLKTQPNTVATFNHPTAASYDSFAYRDAEITHIITMLEVINSNDSIRYAGWLAALEKGWKVSPVCGNDNHGLWGIKNHTSRTFVVATARTKAALLDAMKNRRTYAALDDNIQIQYTVNGAIMGSTLSRPSALDFAITVSDPDAGNRITKIEILKDNGVLVQAHTLAAPQASVTWNPMINDTTSKYFFLRVYNEGSTSPMAWVAPVWTGR